jgi:2-amino-4-hydroxy-6-hydroxymethyldihydropteridine diphosphokinase
MHKKEIVFISLGSNIPDKKSYIENAKKEMIKLKIDIVRESSLYVTEPVGTKGQEDFINQVIKIKTSLAPLKLLIFFNNIETKLGRIPREKWGPREIDIDILFYNDIALNSPELSVPHPEIQNRRFILIPMVEIEKAFIHPVLKQTMEYLLAHTPDKSAVKKLI